MTAGMGLSLPFLRRLLLEDKLLLLLGLFLLLLGGALLGVQYWTVDRTATRILVDRVKAVLASRAGELTAAAEAGDRARLAACARAAAAADEAIQYLVVYDLADGDPLAIANSADAESFLAGGAASGADAARFLEVALPLRGERGRAGTLLAGVDRQRINRITSDMLVTVLALGVLPVALLLLVARVFLRRTVRPLTVLTRVADEISTGNLDPVIDFGVHVNCWEIRNCQQTECKAYMNFDRQCWYVDGTPCDESEPRFPEKLASCRKCVVYRAHRGDEIVQLADSFKHMTHVLKESHENLLKADDFQKRLIWNTFDGIVATDERDIISILNRAAEDVLGVTRERVVGVKHWREYFKDELARHIDLPLTHEPFRRVRGFRMLESKVRREDGTFVDVLLSGISLFERGRFMGKVFFLQDLREVKRLRENLIRSERLAATGQAAASISHAAKNILDGFLGGAYVFKQGRASGDQRKMDKGWEMLERNMDIIARLVKDLLRFAEDRPLDLREHAPARLIEDSMAAAAVGGNGHIAVEMAIDAPRQSVRVDARSFEQCLVDLIRNAAEAIPAERRGSVTVRFGMRGPVPFFAVTDDGAGMSPETIEKVREGMYSTKGSKGTGLGLLIVQKVVGQHGGVLKIESEEGAGSTLRIELPTS